MHEVFWNGLFDVRWEEAPLGPEAIRLIQRLRERGYAERTCRDYGHAVVHLGKYLHEELESDRGRDEGSSRTSSPVICRGVAVTAARRAAAMKRKAIERCAPPAPGPEGESRWHASKDIIQWLEDL